MPDSREGLADTIFFGGEWIPRSTVEETIRKLAERKFPDEPARIERCINYYMIGLDQRSKRYEALPEWTQLKP